MTYLHEDMIPDARVPQFQAKLGIGNPGSVTPEMFGAAGDGVINDTLAFQEALDYLETQGGGILSSALGSQYVVRNLEVPSNVEIKGFFIKQLIEGTIFPDPYQNMKYLFHIKEAENVTIRNNFVDGQRGEQAIEGVFADGGCVGVYIAKGSKNILIEENTITHMATDAVEIFGYVGETTLTDGPYNVRLVNNRFSYSRRNEISILSGIGIQIIGGSLTASGVNVSGSKSGANIIMLGGTPWSAPGIDIEPETHCIVQDVLVSDVLFDGCRTGPMIYLVGQPQHRISDVEFRRITVKNPISGQFVNIVSNGADENLFDLRIHDLALYGTGDVAIWVGKGVTVDGVRNYTSAGVPWPLSFGVFDGQNCRLNIRDSVKNAVFRNVSAGNYGLVHAQFGSNAHDLTNVRFESSCNISPTQDGEWNASISAQRWTPSTPPYMTNNPKLPMFRDALTRFIEPILVSNAKGALPAKKTGFVGWVPTIAYERTIAPSPAGGVLNVNSADASQIGNIIAFKSGGQWYHGTITGVASGTSYNVSPAIPAVGSATTMYGQAWLDWYALVKQPDISPSAETDVAGLNAKINTILTALRNANVIGNG